MAVLKSLFLLLAIVLSALSADARLLGRSVVEGTSMMRARRGRWAYAPAPAPSMHGRMKGGESDKGSEITEPGGEETEELGGGGR